MEIRNRKRGDFCMDNTAIEERRKYYREWRAKNREKVIAAQERYWVKRAAAREQAQTAAADPGQQIRKDGRIIE